MLRSKILSSVLVLLTVMQIACTTTHLRSISDLPEGRGRPVHAEANNWVVVHNGLNNGANEQVLNQLSKACPDSAVKVSMVENKYSFILLGFLYRDHVSAHGYCMDKPVL